MSVRPGTTPVEGWPLPGTVRPGHEAVVRFEDVSAASRARAFQPDHGPSADELAALAGWVPMRRRSSTSPVR